jgi:hypothetical protein
MHVNDVRKLFGGQVFDSPVFGADAALGSDEQREKNAKRLMRDVFAYASEREMDVYFAIDVDTDSANPQELIISLPKSARFAVNGDKFWLADPDSSEGYAFYKAQVAELVRVYPQITWLTAWFRMSGTPWVNLKFEEMPVVWQDEYKALVAKIPESKKLWQSHNMFAIGKILKAFERALKELGRDDVKVAAGSWDFGSMPTANVFFPPSIKLIALDFSILFNQSALVSAEKRRKLAEIGAVRPLIPVIWAHHDDGNYIGRPYRPFEQFHTKLAESKTSGFGIIHWTTRPLDLFFSSHATQVWQSTKNQTLRDTCHEIAGKLFGPSAQKNMSEYLVRWMTNAPKFGRETSSYFIDHTLTDIDKVIADCNERLKLLSSVNQDDLGREQRDHLNYYKGMEEFIAGFYRAQEQLQKAEALLAAGDIAGARSIMSECRPEKVVEIYAKVCSIGSITRGLVVSMNTRWLPHYQRMRQMLGMETVRYNFGATSHDKLAQNPGKFTFHFDAKHQIWQTLGTEETGAMVFSLTENANIMRSSGLPSEYEEICRSGIESDKPITIVLSQIMKGLQNAKKVVAKGKLLNGDYRLRLIMIDPDSTAAGQRVFKILPVNDANIDIYKETGGANRIFELIYPVTIGNSGEISITLTPVHGKATLSGIVIEPITK